MISFILVIFIYKTAANAFDNLGLIGDATELNFRITHAFDDRDNQKKEEGTRLSENALDNVKGNLWITSSIDNPYYGVLDDLDDNYRNRSGTNASVKVTENVYYE